MMYDIMMYDVMMMMMMMMMIDVLLIVHEKKWLPSITIYLIICCSLYRIDTNGR